MEQLYVWMFLPESQKPSLCGVLSEQPDGSAVFNYGRLYAARSDAVSLMPEYRLDAALRDEPLEPLPGDHLPLPFADLGPGRWGEFLMRKRLHRAPRALESLTEVGLARLGAFGFSRSREEAPDSGTGDVLPLQALPDLAEAVASIELAKSVAPEYRYALSHGPSVGGRRPKADFVDSKGQLWIAKFVSGMDTLRDFPLLEAFGLSMARRCGIDAPAFRVETVRGQAVLMVQRFDRRPNGGRDHVISARSLLRVSEAALDLDGSYPAIAALLRRQGTPADIGERWFDRMAFNIVLGNTDDHPLNHLFGWDGADLRLMPAFDLEPCGGRDDGRHQMRIGKSGFQGSVENALSMAAEFGLSARQARSRIERIQQIFREAWRTEAEALNCGPELLGHIQAGLRL
jgi:serine/threonine-protein kinase HipA